MTGRRKLGARNQKTMGNVPKSDETGVAEGILGSVPSVPANDDVLASKEQMP